MDYKKYRFENCSVEAAHFDVGRREAHVMIHADIADGTFTNQLNGVIAGIEKMKEELGEGMEPVFIRWFLSDAENQASAIPANAGYACSIIQQPPMDTTKVAVWMIFQEKAGFEEKEPGVWENGRGEIWVADRDMEGFSDRYSYSMTLQYLESLSSALEERGGTLADHCVRTWFMVRDVDVNYAGVVRGRNDLFTLKGLTSDTHFISSTGINGVSRRHTDTVAFNAYCNLSLSPSQIQFLQGSTHLNPTAEYGVAFERGTCVRYGDREHVFISGTASIDNHGEIVHPGNVAAQTDRMLENIGVLLSEADCGFEDVAHFLVYIRDTSDAPVIKRIFAERYPDVPTVVLLAPVCRPGWLIETECMAVKKIDMPQFQTY